MVRQINVFSILFNIEILLPRVYCEFCQYSTIKPSDMRIHKSAKHLLQLQQQQQQPVQWDLEFSNDEFDQMLKWVDE